eukprot:881528-Rhodomonas_salina.1
MDLHVDSRIRQNSEGDIGTRKCTGQRGADHVANNQSAEWAESVQDIEEATVFETVARQLANGRPTPCLLGVPVTATLLCTSACISSEGSTALLTGPSTISSISLEPRMQHGH